MSRATPVLVGACAGGGGVVSPPATSAADAIPSRSGSDPADVSPVSTAAGVVDSRTGRLFPVRPHARLTADYWNAVLRRLETTPPKIVAYEMGVSWESLRMRLSRAGARAKPTDAEGLYPRQSRVVAMRRDGKTHAEIAEAMCISVGTVNTVLYRARKKGIAI